jgi:hypothetical protein
MAPIHVTYLVQGRGVTQGGGCTRCGTSLIGLGRSAHVHHVKELRTAPALRIEPQNLRPLCVSCHDVTHAEMKRKPAPACDVDGNPLDPDHPWNVSK